LFSVYSGESKSNETVGASVQQCESEGKRGLCEMSSSGPRAPSLVAASGKSDELRSLIRVAATSDNSILSATTLLTNLFLGSGSGSGSGEASASTASTELTRETFCNLIGGVRGVRARFTPNDLIDIYNEASTEIRGGGLTTKVTTGAIVDYFSSAMSKTRAWSIKLRSAIMQDFEGVDEYKRAFSSMSTGSSNIVDINAFTDFAEDMLDLDENSITEAEAKALYAIFDVNNDGELSLDDFLAFMLGQTAEAIKQLKSGNGEVIVDVKVSTTPVQDAALRAQGYTIVLPDSSFGVLGQDHGSFGKGYSLWIWRRKQGTCSGRLKPIVDIQLDSSSPSSNSVLVGYQSVSTPLGSYCVWIKRATNEDEEKDAIVDVKVTIGKAKNSSDKIHVSPGVGWVVVGHGGTEANFGPRGIFNSSDAFLWFRPSRARTMDSAMVTVLNATAAMTDETRQAKLLSAMRSAVRNHVPLSEIRRLSNLQMELNDASGGGNKGQLRSERLFDYAALFHLYTTDNKSGFMSRANFQKMLNDVGINMDSADVARCFNYFDKDLDGKISRVEFAHEIELTGYETDLIIERIRNKLLSNNVLKSKLAGQQNTRTSTTSAAALAGLEDPNSKNALRDSRILSHIFRHVNVNRDSILSLDEILDLAARLEIFLTEGEARRIATDMDVNGDDRIEEADFITFMKRSSEVVIKKANRLHSAAAKLRRWLISGTNTASSALVAVSAEQWNEFKVKHDKSTLRKFPGYLGSEDLVRSLASLGYALTNIEARELLLLVAPEANGKISQADLNAFMNRSARSLGELVALLERDVMKVAIDLFRSSWSVYRSDGVPDSMLADNFASNVKDIVKRVQTSQVSSGVMRSGMLPVGAPQPSSKISTSHDVVSVAQLKAGIEASMGRVPTQGACMMPNLEEYACLASLVGALVADDETLGVNAKKFVEGVCAYVVKFDDVKATGGEVVTLDVLCRDLRRMIREEAKVAGSGRTYDFVTVFSVFDEDGGGTISLSEFKAMLKRLQLIDKLPEKQVPALLECFDRNKKGHVTFDDFLAFVETNRDEDDDDYALDDDDQADEIGLSSNTPPTSVTRNADCDWLLWFLWRQACRVSPRDPENVLAEVEAACVAADKRANSGSTAGEVTIKTFWNILGDKKLHGAMTRGQFDRGVKFVVHDGTGKDEDPMDYESVARYTVRMGRTFNGLLQQRRVVDEKKFSHLRASLIKELLEIDSSTNSANQVLTEDDGIHPPSSSSFNQNQITGSRFERVLRRLDTNSDGLLTVPEFKMALKRLKIRDEKKWTAAMVRRLFDERATSARGDGKLSIADFGKMVRGDADFSGPSSSFGKNGAAGASGNLSDDEDDDIFSAPKSVTSDSALYRKASDILLELVPLASNSYSPGAITAHVDAVRTAVRHFFTKADPQGRGCVTEDEFRIFARKSGLQARLRVAELRKLISKLRRRAGDDSGPAAGGDDGEGRLYSGRGHSSSNNDSSMVDYEKLCKIIGPSSDSQPRSRVDALMLRIQEASEISTAQGRSFLALCTLTDPMLCGHITETELGIVMKMMGCPITAPEVDMVRDLINDIEVENQRQPKDKASERSGRDSSPDGRGGGKSSKSVRIPKGNLDYRQINVLIQTYQCARFPIQSYEAMSVNEMRHSTRALGALPAYATYGGSGVTRMPTSTLRGVPPLDIARTVPTPGGLFVSTPMPPSSGHNMGMSMGYDTRLHASRTTALQGGTVYDRSLSTLAEKIKSHARRSQSAQPPLLLLRRRLETADRSLTGVVAEEVLQIVLDDMNVTLSPSDLYALRSRFGNMQGGIDYEALLTALLDAADFGQTGSGGFGTWEATPSVVRRVREMSADGIGIRQAFADYDFDGNGVVRKSYNLLLAEI